MKTAKHIHPAPQRRIPATRKARHRTHKAPACHPQPATRHHDFLALCLYPGMGGHSTAA